MVRVCQAVCLALLGLTLACGGGGGGGGSTPTQPQASGNLVTVSVTVTSFNLGFGIDEATLSLDGREIARKDWHALAGQACAGGCQITGMVNNVSAGSHTVLFTVVRQSRTTIRYAAIGVVVVRTLSTGADRRIDLPRQDTTLQAGQSLTYTVNI